MPTFGVLAALGLLTALSLTGTCARFCEVSGAVAWDAGVFAVAAAFVISRLILVATNLRSFLEYPVLVLRVPSLTGLGLLLTAFAIFVYLRFRRVSLLGVMDAWAVPGCVLWAFLAVGHLMEGSDPGLPSRAMWAVRVPPDPDLQQPVGLFAAVFAVVIAWCLYGVLRRRHPAGMVAAMGLVLVGLAQFVLTFVRQPYPYAPDAPGFLLDPIQFVAVGMVLAGGLLYGAVVSRGRGPVELRQDGLAAGEVR